MAGDPNECGEQAERYIALDAILRSYRNIRRMFEQHIPRRTSDRSWLFALSYQAVAFGAF
jgi:hypothetical protein